ncbi:MAG TPA: YdcF family protein [Flavobacteriales bacterium]|nr:YdcF family protein [Flavobacteriales bacterium]
MRRVGVLLAVLLCCWLLRIQFLSALGDWLIAEDGLEHADAIVVLGGAPLERAPVGARLLREGWAPHLIFTGELPDEKLALYGIARTEASVGLDAAGLDSTERSRVRLLEMGTSTQEEAMAIRDFALENSLSRIIVVTTEFHTRRAGKVFRKALEPAGITVLVRAAPGTDYDPKRWWEREAGMIMVNNECMKTLYYAVKH